MGNLTQYAAEINSEEKSKPCQVAAASHLRRKEPLRIINQSLISGLTKKRITPVRAQKVEAAYRIYVSTELLVANSQTY